MLAKKTYGVFVHQMALALEKLDSPLLVREAYDASAVHPRATQG